ncbi:MULTISPECIES: (2,3-dihydroxybenzoyl)adenylate synthase [Catenuloplanes]|uniref:2,3-dihydroxybenzoate-AMP ligase n=1 Tax=Catenuloplanes niger TaxID=587534 RepID=A0AAE3ZTB5_9ACTN|nr:(2,3-dihydroxybenzoyl)adenylate synthase [Catenuloplanes niger]MDR7325698.1 2,3-dihydroxybenzoate-AMP ligase [Catenuloplanes niger]
MSEPAAPPSTDFTPWPAATADRYRAAGYWQGETFSAWLHGLAARFGDRVAVVDGQRRWTYAELDEAASRTAGTFEGLGVSRGDRVVVQLPNIGEFLPVVLGLFRLGALPVFTLPSHRRAEIGHLAAATDAVAYVIPGVWERFDYHALAAEVRAAVPSLRLVIDATALGQEPSEPFDGTDVSAGDVAFLQLSGGSTGLPKLIPRTHDDYLYSVRASAEICRLSSDTVYLVALPVAHNFTMSSPGVLGVLHAGGRVVMCPAPSPAVAFPLIAAQRVTMTALVPPLALVWLDAAAGATDDLSSLELLQVGGARLADEAAARVRPVLGCALQQVFGMAEGLVNYTRHDDPPELVVGTQGRPISPDDEIRIVDSADVEVPAGTVGHLLTRGPYTIRGYYRAAEHNAVAFTADGFYRTGDLVRQLPSGHLVVEGRAKDQINRGGEKIAAEEVENHLLAHPAVLDASIVAVPDPVLGERSCAYVILRSGAPALTAGQVRAFVRSRGLAAYKVPDRVEFVDSFPQTAVGKVSKARLRHREGLS